MTPSEVNTTLGARVKALREARQWRIERLAAELDMSHQAVRNFEKGQGSIRSERLPLLGQVFGVSLDYLFGLTDDPTPAHDQAAVGVA